MSTNGRLRTDAISDIFVETSRAQAAFTRIDELMERGWEANFCRALLLLGPARCGKTHILKEWTRRRHEANPEFKATITEVPPGCTLKGMAAQLLEDLGDPDPDYGSQNDKTRRIQEIGGGRDLIIIDEVQRLIDEKTEKVKKDVANWLTNLLNRRICPLLLVGERHAELVFQGNMYLEGRTIGQVPVEPYDWHESKDRLEFRTFLNLVDGELGLSERSNLGELDTALRIHAFSVGRIGQATLLVDEARSLARRHGRPKLTREIFAEAVDLLRVGAARERPNPFRVENPTPGGEAPNVRDAARPATEAA
jgi:predicted AAA+ superfamily ATPase